MRGIFNVIGGYTWSNPILLTELTRSLRQSKIVIIQTVYLSILTAVVYIVWTENSNSYYGFDPASVGKDIFNAILFLQFLAISLLCPAFTCADISSEIEKQSFDLLVTSLLNSKEIIMGKLASTITHIVLFLLSSLPLMCMVFYFGGISPLDILLAYFFILVVAILYSILGLFMSARLKKTTASIALTYGLIFFLFIFCSGTFFDRLFSYNSNFFSENIDFYFFHLPIWSVFFFEVLYVSLLFFLGAAYLIQIPAPPKSGLICKLLSIFYIINILCYTLYVCNYYLPNNANYYYWNEPKFYQLFLFFSMALIPFFVWPGDWYVNKLKFRINHIFCFNNRFSMFFIPLLTLFALFIIMCFFLSFSIMEFPQLTTVSTIIFLFIYLLAIMGRWISLFFKKEEHFLITFLAVCWVPIIISFIIRKSNYNSDPPLYMKVLDPFMSIDALFDTSNFSFASGSSVIVYFMLAFIFTVMVAYANYSGKGKKSEVSEKGDG